MVPVESPADNADELAAMGKLHIIWDTVALLPHNSTSRPTEGNISKKEGEMRVLIAWEQFDAPQPSNV